MTTEAAEATGTANTEAGESTQTTAATDAAATETQTPEAKGEANADTKATDDAGKADGAKADEPIAYEFKAPEGMELDSASLGEFKAIAAELKLPAEAAQKMVDIAIKREQARAEAFAAQVNEWGEQVKADKEVGGAKLDENLGVARKAIDQFGTPELKSLLDSTGMGNHPEVVKLMVRIGRAISEDKIVRGESSAAPKDTASILYGSTT